MNQGNPPSNAFGQQNTANMFQNGLNNNNGFNAGSQIPGLGNTVNSGTMGNNSMFNQQQGSFGMGFNQPSTSGNQTGMFSNQPATSGNQNGIFGNQPATSGNQNGIFGNQTGMFGQGNAFGNQPTNLLGQPINPNANFLSNAKIGQTPPAFQPNMANSHLMQMRK
jgi:hypothetical protein